MFFEKYWKILRREYYWRFNKKHIMESVAKRKGFCDWQNCKDCCFYKIPCRSYERETNKCLDWGFPERMRCDFERTKASPFDEKDKPDRIKAQCKYYWEIDGGD